MAKACFGVTGTPNAPAILAAGAITALGPTLRHTALFLRAGQDHLVESPFIDQLGEHVVMNATPILSANSMRTERLCQLAERACRDALPSSADGIVRAPRLCLVVPQRYRGRQRDLAQIEQAVRSALPPGFSSAPCDWCFGQGEVGAVALSDAAKWLYRGDTDGVLICAVDSYYDWDVLEPLLEADCLLTADNLDGRRPGEAAAALLLGSPHHPWSAVFGTRIASAAVAQEPFALGSEQPSRGQGITRALHALRAGSHLSDASVHQFLADTTHEAYRVRELQLILARFGINKGEEE